MPNHRPTSFQGLRVQWVVLQPAHLHEFGPLLAYHHKTSTTARGVHGKELTDTLFNKHKSLHLCPASHVSWNRVASNVCTHSSIGSSLTSRRLMTVEPPAGRGVTSVAATEGFSVTSESNETARGGRQYHGNMSWYLAAYKAPEGAMKICRGALQPGPRRYHGNMPWYLAA